MLGNSQMPIFSISLLQNEQKNIFEVSVGCPHNHFRNGSAALG